MITSKRYRLPSLAFIPLLIAWLTTYLSWTSWIGGAAFAVNLYDLAEWGSLTPYVRYGPQPMLLPFVLRIIPALLAVTFALYAARWHNAVLKVSVYLLAGAICIGLLPPLDFFRGQTDDINYRQQFFIAVGSGIAVLITLIPIFRGRFAVALALLLSIGAAACTGIGVRGGIDTFAPYKMTLGVGPGSVLTFAGLLVFVLLTVREVFFNHATNRPTL